MMSWSRLADRLLWPILVISLVLSSAFSYYRFVLQHNYFVSYEIDCDPRTHDCFVGCDDLSCSAQHFYASIERHAAHVHELCGPDITGCPEASTCSPSENQCTIYYCDDTDPAAVCEHITEHASQENDTEPSTQTSTPIE